VSWATTQEHSQDFWFGGLILAEDYAAKFEAKNKIPGSFN